MTPRSIDIDREVRAWVAAGCDLPAASVIPGNDDGPTPPYPYATVVLIDQTLAGEPWTNPALGAMAYADVADALQTAWRRLARLDNAGAKIYPYAGAGAVWQTDRFALTYPAGIPPQAFDPGPLADAMGISRGAAGAGNTWRGPPIIASPTYLATRATAGLSLAGEPLPAPELAAGLLAVTTAVKRARYSVQWHGDTSVLDYALRFELWAHSYAVRDMDFWLAQTLPIRQLDDVVDDVKQARGWERRVGMDVEIGYYQQLSVAAQRFADADVAIVYDGAGAILREDI